METKLHLLQRVRYLSGSDYLPISQERRDWGAKSVGPRRPLATNSKVPAVELRRDVRPAQRRLVPSRIPLGLGCSYCAARFTSDGQLEEHIIAEHVANTNDTSENARAKPLVRVNGQVFERRMLRRSQPSVAQTDPTLRTVAAPRVLQVSPPKTSSVNAVTVSTAHPKRPLIQCPKCPSPVRADRLSKHLRDQHGVREASQDVVQKAQPARTPSSARAPARKLTKQVAASGGTARSRAMAQGKGHSGPAHVDDDERVNQIDNYWEERRLDGSRDYWQIRESGRFGSHPSYDDCDDESAP